MNRVSTTSPKHINLSLCWVLILFVFVTATSCQNGKGPDKEHSENKISAQALPNIVFYLADDQDVYDYGCYGNDKVHTSAVDRLAQEGMLFENAFTGQAICAPSRSQLFTGKYPLRNGCFVNHTPTYEDVQSITAYLGELGYDVVLAGKSHVKPASVYQWDKEWSPVKKEGSPRDYIPMDSIAGYMANAKRPFCMFITSMFPHGKYFDVPPRSAENLKFYPFDEAKKTNEAYRKKRSGYYRSVAEDNAQLEFVLQQVDTYLKENTLFIYSADHGVSGKFTVYDRGLQVPFVARWPGVIKPSTRSKALIHYTDVLPTLMDIAGAKPNTDFDGKSFLPLLKGGQQEIHDYVYGVQTNQGILAAAIFPSRMIRNTKYKYIRNFNSVEVMEQNFTDNPYVNAFIEIGAKKFKEKPFEELYDIQKDPFETQNLAREQSYDSIKEKLAHDLLSWMRKQEDILSENSGIPLIKTKRFDLDKNRKTLKVPDSLQNVLKSEDYTVFKS